MNKKEKRDYSFKWRKWRVQTVESSSIKHKEILDNVTRFMKNDDQKRKSMLIRLIVFVFYYMSKTIHKWLGVKNPEFYDSDLTELTNLAAEVKVLRKRTELLEGLLWITYCWLEPTNDKVFNKHLDNIYNALQKGSSCKQSS